MNYLSSNLILTNSPSIAMDPNNNSPVLPEKQNTNFQFQQIFEISGPKENTSCEDRLYHWLLKWFANNMPSPFLDSTIINSSSPICNASQQTNYDLKGAYKQNEDGSQSPRVIAYPGFNVSIPFTYKEHSFSMTRTIVPNVTNGGNIYEKITIFSDFSKCHLIGQLLKECIPIIPPPEVEENMTTIYVPSGTYWDTMGKPKKIRPLSSVILNETAKTKLISDIEEFQNSKDWYNDRGIPHRRGYLLYGPPGCGKSSLIRAIAGEFNVDICILSLTAAGLTDSCLGALMNNTPEDAIIVLEDVDAAFTSREGKPSSGTVISEPNQSFVTFAGLLNCLDGVGSVERRVTIMTTNYVDRLDPALIRPGRVDMKMQIGYPDDTQLGSIFEVFYPEAGDELKAEFVQRCRAFGGSDVSMAAAQGLFMFYKNNVHEAVGGVEEYFNKQILVGGATATVESARGVFC